MKSWQEKLEKPQDLPKVVKIKGKMSRRWGTGTVVIPHPKEVYELMEKVPKGKLITINEIRKKVAKKHKATIGCPITCGIFAWVSANAAEEIVKNKKTKVMPYWRTLKSTGEINEKYPGGIAGQKKLLEREGHTVIRKGKKLYVEDYEKSLFKL